MIRPIAIVMMALTGSFFFFVFVAQDIRSLPDLDMGQLPWGLIIRYAVSMAIGGAIAGAILCGLFGRAGIGGWLLAFLAGILAATLAGLFGSAIGDLPDILSDGWSSSDIVRMVAGLLVLPLALAEQPALIIVLVTMVTMTHILIRRRRQVD